MAVLAEIEVGPIFGLLAQELFSTTSAHPWQPDGFIIDLVRGCFQGLAFSVLIAKLKVFFQWLPGIGHGIIGIQINLLTFHTAPQSFDKHIVPQGSLAIHPDTGFVFVEYFGKRIIRELAVLIRVKYFRPTITLYYFHHRQKDKYSEFLERVATPVSIASLAYNGATRLSPRYQGPCEGVILDF